MFTGKEDGALQAAAVNHEVGLVTLVSICLLAGGIQLHTRSKAVRYRFFADGLPERVIEFV